MHELIFILRSFFPSSSVKIQRNALMIACWIATLSDGVARICIPLYFTSLGFSPTNIGVMFVSYEVFGLLANFCSGFFINRFGYRAAFIFAMILHSCASFGYLIFNPSLDFALAMLLISSLRALRGVGEEFIKTTSTAWFKHLIPKSDKSFAIQILLGGKEGAKGIGLMVGGISLTWIGFKMTFVVFGLLTLFAALIAFLMLTDITETRKIPYRKFSNVKKQMHILATARAFLYAGRDVWLVIAIPIVLTQKGVSPVAISTIIAMGLIIFGITQPIFAHIFKSEYEFKNITKKKWRYRSVLPLATASLIAIPMLTLALEEDMVGLLCVILSYNLIAGIATAPHNHLHLKYANKKSASTDIAYYKTIAHLGKVFAALFSGVLLQYVGLIGCLIAASFCLVVTTALSAALSMTTNKNSIGNTGLQEPIK